MVARNPADVDHLFAERLSAGDLDGALAMYEDGAVYIDGDGTESRGRAEIRAVPYRIGLRVSKSSNSALAGK